MSSRPPATGSGASRISHHHHWRRQHHVTSLGLDQLCPLSSPQACRRAVLTSRGAFEYNSRRASAMASPDHLQSDRHCCHRCSCSFLLPPASGDAPRGRDERKPYRANHLAVGGQYVCEKARRWWRLHLLPSLSVPTPPAGASLWLCRARATSSTRSPAGPSLKATMRTPPDDDESLTTGRPIGRQASGGGQNGPRKSVAHC
jgi:hypothetical protein